MPAHYLAATGTSDPGPGGAPAERQADLRARQAFAATLADYARTALRGFFAQEQTDSSPEGPMVEQFIDALAAEFTSDVLTDAQMHRSWRPKNVNTHVEYRMTYPRAHERLVQLLPTVAGRLNPFSVPAQEAAEQLQAYLQERARSRLTRDVQQRNDVPDAGPEQRVPDWVRTGRHADYPPGEYFSSVGLAARFEQARSEALASIVDQVRNTMESRTRDRLQKAPESALAKNLGEFDIADIPLSAKDLSGAVPAARWEDPVTSIHYVLCVTDRGRTARRHVADAQKAAEQARGRIESSGNHEKADNIASAINDALEAATVARDAVRSQAIALGAAPPAERHDALAAVQSPVLLQARARAQALLASLRLEVESGDSQWTPPSGPPPEPLVVRVTAGEGKVPVHNLPVAFRATGPGATDLATVRTDQDGRARLKLTEGVRTRRIMVEPDVAQMHKAAAADTFTVPGARFDLVLRSPDNIRFAVYVVEKSGELELPPRIGPAVKQALRDAGYAVLGSADIEEHAIPLQGMPEPKPEDILRLFEPVRKEVEPEGFLMVVVGRADVGHVQDLPSDDGPINIYECPFRLRMFDPAGPEPNEPVVGISGKGRGAFTDRPRQAAERALLDAGRTAADELTEEAVDLLGRPELPAPDAP